MTGSSVEKLTNAVLTFDQKMDQLSLQAQEYAGEIVKYADQLARELENDVDILVKQLEEEIRKYVEEKSEELKKSYASMKEEKLREIKYKAETNKDAAVNAVVEELKKLLSEV
ncbi:MAG: hypothetical protein F7C36_00165 [Desulfurococcales archaeon]|nr:hypothetical protein [Desulfurococcales archaeon]